MNHSTASGSGRVGGGTGVTGVLRLYREPALLAHMKQRRRGNGNCMLYEDAGVASVDRAPQGGRAGGHVMCLACFQLQRALSLDQVRLVHGLVV